jgi:hypothetical protein
MKQCLIKYLKNGPYDVHHMYTGRKQYTHLYTRNYYGVVLYLVLFVILPIEVKMIRLVLIKRTWQRDGLFNFFFIQK